MMPPLPSTFGTGSARPARHPGRRGSGWVVLCVALATALLAAPAATDDSSPTPDAIAATVRELEQAIQADRARLLVLVSTERGEDAVPLHADPDLRAIARRLPRLERELERWAKQETRPSAPSTPRERE